MVPCFMSEVENFLDLITSFSSAHFACFAFDLPSSIFIMGFIVITKLIIPSFQAFVASVADYSFRLPGFNSTFLISMCFIIFE